MTWTWRDELRYWVCITLAVAIITTTVFFGVRWGYRFRVSLERSECQRWGETVELDTKLVRIRVFGYDCFAHTEIGWIDKDSLINTRAIPGTDGQDDR